MPRIKSFETWVCQQKRDEQDIPHHSEGFRFSDLSRVIVLKLTDEDGFEGVGTCVAEHSARVPVGYLQDMVAPLLVGRDVYHREAFWKEIWEQDRRVRLFPINILGCVDVALWEIAAKRAELPLYQYLGAARTSLPAYYSMLYFDSAEDYIREVEKARSRGFKAIKVHARDEFDVYTAVREAAGPDMTLMADTAADWTYEKALRVGRHLEKLNYYWFEEPFRDWNLERYAKLCASLDIPIAATEVTSGGLWGVAQAIRYQAVDIVRADVAWGKMGVTETLKIAHLAEAFGMNCEIHCTSMGPMDIANLHVSCAINNCEFFELIVPETIFKFPMKDPYPIDDQGIVHVPQKPGLGIEIDWDAVDNATHERLSIGQ